MEKFHHLWVWREASGLVSYEVRLPAPEKVGYYSTKLLFGLAYHSKQIQLIFWLQCYYRAYTNKPQLIGFISLRKEIDLLQKLYGLYDAVMSKIGGYNQILWTKVDIEKINAELLEFQNRWSILNITSCWIPKQLLYTVYAYFFWICRCRKLPKALKEWQAFFDLRKTIDDFSESCPLLEKMANKSMMRRHWDQIAALTGHKFEIESSTFTLQNIMDAPLLSNKDDIEVFFHFLQN